jgi:phosphotriesterase-related protein
MNKKSFLLLFLLCLSLSLVVIGCTEEKPIIMTVAGSIDASQMGISLTHEHILVDFIGADKIDPNRYCRREVVEKVLPFLMETKAYGVKTLMECTPAYLGRDPILLQTLSQKTGLQIITNTGYYGAVNNKFIPEQAFEETAEQLSERWIKEWHDGIEQTGVRPGFIKISIDANDKLSQMHKKIVIAAAIAHLHTGLTIASHTGSGKSALEQIDLLEQYGVSPKAFIWVHAQSGEPSSHIVAAKKGAWISFDNVTGETRSIEKNVKQILNLKNKGLLHTVLISHDAGWYSVGELNGGTVRPYTAIFTHLLPALKMQGFTDHQLNQLLVVNPQNAFSIHVRKHNK